MSENVLKLIISFYAQENGIEEKIRSLPCLGAVIFQFFVCPNKEYLTDYPLYGHTEMLNCSAYEHGSVLILFPTPPLSYL